MSARRQTQITHESKVIICQTSADGSLYTLLASMKGLRMSRRLFSTVLMCSERVVLIALRWKPVVLACNIHMLQV